MGLTNGHGLSKAPCDAFLRGECTLGSKCSRSHRVEDLISSSVIDDAASDAPIDYDVGIVHDNNHADIRKIQILPTFDEIQSMLPAHLPPFNPQLWHESGIKGLIDRQFRLFRASAINELVQRLRIELHSLQGTSLEDQQSLVRRWPTFENAIVEEILHRHHEGFKIRISFDQPCQSRTSQQRSGFWVHSKHMKWSNIVALLTEDRLVFSEKIALCSVRSLALLLVLVVWRQCL